MSQALKQKEEGEMLRLRGSQSQTEEIPEPEVRPNQRSLDYQSPCPDFFWSRSWKEENWGKDVLKTLTTNRNALKGILFQAAGISCLSQQILQPLKLTASCEGISWHSKVEPSPRQVIHRVWSSDLTSGGSNTGLQTGLNQSWKSQRYSEASPMHVMWPRRKRQSHSMATGRENTWFTELAGARKSLLQKNFWSTLSSQ